MSFNINQKPFPPTAKNQFTKIRDRVLKAFKKCRARAQTAVCKTGITVGYCKPTTIWLLLAEVKCRRQSTL